MTTSQVVAEEVAFPNTHGDPSRQSGTSDNVVHNWRGKAAVLALFLISAAGYTLAAFVIDTMTKGGSSLF
jgi:hypothetical protein